MQKALGAVWQELGARKRGYNYDQRYSRFTMEFDSPFFGTYTLRADRSVLYFVIPTDHVVGVSVNLDALERGEEAASLALASALRALRESHVQRIEQIRIAREQDLAKAVRSLCGHANLDSLSAERDRVINKFPEAEAQINSAYLEAVSRINGAREEAEIQRATKAAAHTAYREALVDHRRSVTDILDANRALLRDRFASWFEPFPAWEVTYALVPCACSEDGSADPEIQTQSYYSSDDHPDVNGYWQVIKSGAAAKIRLTNVVSVEELGPRTWAQLGVHKIHVPELGEYIAYPPAFDLDSARTRIASVDLHPLPDPPARPGNLEEWEARNIATSLDQLDNQPVPSFNEDID